MSDKHDLKPYIIGLAAFVLLMFMVGMLYSYFTKGNPRVLGVEEMVDMQVPQWYTQALVVSRGEQSLSVTPLAGSRVQVERKNNQYIYHDAYPNTDVVQTEYHYKIKEELIFKQPGHPIKFQYRLGDVEKYYVEEDEQGNIIFYDQELYEKYGGANNLSRVFTIFTPFIQDQRKRSFEDIEAIIEGDLLTVTINENWLIDAQYPVIVDPTIEINVINIHSHPQQGDYWEVSFTTQGRADLKIIPADQATIDDDEFVSLWCGNEQRQPQILADDVIFYPDWSCPSADKSAAEASEGIGKVVHYTKKAGKHTLKFDFGGQIAWAYNDPSDPWMNTNWDYRKEHDITGSSGAGTDYQIKITVHYGSGSDSGENVYLDSKCKTDFGDIRFTDDDGTTELDYWMQEKTDGDNAVFWIEVADNLDSNQTIYIYYGNASASTTSNGSNTFLFFDDFSGDLSKWSRDKTSGVYPEIPSGQTYVRCGGGTTGSPYGHTSLGSSPTYTGFNNNAVVYRARVSTNGIGEVAFRGSYAGNTGYKNRFDQRSGQGNSFLKPPYSGWGFLSSCTGDSDIPAVDTWYVYDITAMGTAFKMYRNGVLKKSCSDASYSSAGEIALQNHYGSYTDYDWVAARKFVDSEPVHSTWGAEEEQPAANSQPIITSASAPSVQPGADITFRVNWDDADSGEQVKVKICQTDSLTNLICDGGWWASSTAFSSANPAIVSTTTKESWKGHNDYWVFVCDDSDASSSPYRGSFYVGYTTQIVHSQAKKWITGLVGLWTFDGPDIDWGTNTAYDRSGQGNNGAITNMCTSSSPVIGKVGQALSFDGSDDYVEICDGRISDATEGTISAWVYASELENGAKMVAYGGGNVGDPGGFIFDIRLDTNYYFGVVQKSDGGSWSAIRGNTQLSPNTWYHAVLTSNGTSWSMYVNGQKESLSSLPVDVDGNNGDWFGDTSVAETDKTSLGNIMYGGSYVGTYFAGLIDEVRIYNRTLDAGEIKEIYNASASSHAMKPNSPITDYYTDGLVGHWTFNGEDMDWSQSSAEARDRSGQDKHGDVNGAKVTIGQVGQALEFDGVNDRIDLPRGAFDNLTQGTMVAWVKCVSNGGVYPFCAQDGSGNYGYYFFFGPYQDKLWVHVRTGASADNALYAEGTTTLSNDIWYQVVFTVESGVGNKLFINGIQETMNYTDGDATTDVFLSDIGGASLYYPVGANMYQGSYGYQTGLIDEVRVYNRALSADEVLSLYQTGAREVNIGKVAEFSVIVDDQDTENFSKTGTWAEVWDSQAYNGHCYETDDWDQEITATWTPHLPTGAYNVYARWHGDDTHCQSVPYTITYAEGDTTVYVNQRQNGGIWNYLGTFTFNTDAGDVTILYYVTDNDQYRVSADAVKFVKVPSP